MKIDHLAEFKRYHRFIKRHVFLVGGIIWKESTFNPLATKIERAYYDRYIADNEEWQERMKKFRVGPFEVCTSIGLMQVMYPTAWMVGYRGEPHLLFDPETNIEIGSRYFDLQIEKYSGMDKPLDYAVAAYNAGTPHLVDEKMFANQSYVDDVFENARTLETMYRLDERRNPGE